MKRFGFWLPPRTVNFNNFKATKQNNNNKEIKTNKQKTTKHSIVVPKYKTYVQADMTKANANGMSGFLRDARAG